MLGSVIAVTPPPPPLPAGGREIICQDVIGMTAPSPASPVVRRLFVQDPGAMRGAVGHGLMVGRGRTHAGERDRRETPTPSPPRTGEGDYLRGVIGMTSRCAAPCPA